VNFETVSTANRKLHTPANISSLLDCYGVSSTYQDVQQIADRPSTLVAVAELVGLTTRARTHVNLQREKSKILAWDLIWNIAVILAVGERLRYLMGRRRAPYVKPASQL
jgi:hypothetical protein